MADLLQLGICADREFIMPRRARSWPQKIRPIHDPPRRARPDRRLKIEHWAAIVAMMIHENLAQSIENLSARMIAIRDSL